MRILKFCSCRDFAKVEIYGQMYGNVKKQNRFIRTRSKITVAKHEQKLAIKIELMTIRQKNSNLKMYSVHIILPENSDIYKDS